MNKVVYNPLKLSEYRPLFHDLHVLVIGAGAVGTHLMEKFAKWDFLLTQWISIALRLKMQPNTAV